MSNEIGQIKESKLYQQFAGVSKDKTSIIINEALMRQNPLYRRMFESQAKWYQ